MLGNLTQDFVHVRQVFYHWAISLALLMTSQWNSILFEEGKCLLVFSVLNIQNLSMKLQEIVYFIMESLKDILKHALKFGFIILCACVWAWVCICAPRVCRCPQRSGAVTQSLGTGVIGSCEPLSLEPPQEQPSAAEPPLQRVLPQVTPSLRLDFSHLTVN